MTIASETNRVTYAGNAVTTAFAFAAPYRASTDFEVTLRTDATGSEAAQSLATHYTIAGVANTGTGGYDSMTLTMLTAPPTGSTLIINRKVPPTTALDASAGAAVSAPNLEGAIDRAMLAMQGLQEQINRAVLLPKSSALSVLTLPDPVINADGYLKWNSAGTAVEAVEQVDLSGTTVSAFAATLLDDTTAAAARTTLGATGPLSELTTDATGGANADHLPFVDNSEADASNKVAVTDFLYNSLNNRTADTAPDHATDHVMTRDDSAAAAKKVLLQYIGAGKQTIFLPAAAMTSRTTNGAAPGTTESTTNKVMNKTLDFDATTAEYAQFTVPFPKSWNLGTVSFIPFWTAASGSGTASFSLAGVALSNDDAIDTAFGTAVVSTDTLLTALDVHVGPESAAVTIGGAPAVGDLVYFQVARDVSDTLAVDAKLIGIQLIYTTSVNTDA